MKQCLLITLLLTLGATASADEVRHSWCQGFIVKGLAQFPIDGLSRVELWLDWNEVSQRNIEKGGLNESQYQAGRDAFDNLFSAGNTRSLIDTYEQDCAAVRGGWRWW
jgi:hypothetical protein